MICSRQSLNCGSLEIIKIAFPPQRLIESERRKMYATEMWLLIMQHLMAGQNWYSTRRVEKNISKCWQCGMCVSWCVFTNQFAEVCMFPEVRNSLCSDVCVANVYQSFCSGMCVSDVCQCAQPGMCISWGHNLRLWCI